MDNIPLWMIAFDPGKSKKPSTGWAKFGPKGELLGLGIWSIEELDKWAISTKPGDFEHLVYEKYIMYPDNIDHHMLKENPTEQAVGVIQLGGRRAGAKIHAQQANIKAVAEKWSGANTSNMPHSSSHSIDAYNHGIFWLVKRKIIPIPSLTNRPKRMEG